nr:uncharacterized protein I203_06456 [Kwoniella mangroviensis CBS 8507]OCF64275.1 hypothetical protein I203_06456 [Kwoniella mangroviensis CBS 8507]
MSSEDRSRYVPLPTPPTRSQGRTEQQWIQWSARATLACGLMKTLTAEDIETHSEFLAKAEARNWVPFYEASSTNHSSVAPGEGQGTGGTSSTHGAAGANTGA